MGFSKLYYAILIFAVTATGAMFISPLLNSSTNNGGIVPGAVLQGETTTTTTTTTSSVGVNCTYAGNPVIGQLSMNPSNVTNTSQVSAVTVGWGSLCANYIFSVRLPVGSNYCAGQILCAGTLNSQGSGSCSFIASIADGIYYNIAACVDRNNNGNVTGDTQSAGEQSYPTFLIVNSTVSNATPPAFNVSGFACSQKSGGANCSLAFANGLNESVIIVYIVSDVAGNTASSIAYIAGQRSSTSLVNYFCKNPGNYTMSWQAYSLSDANLATPVSYSNPPQRQLMVC